MPVDVPSEKPKRKAMFLGPVALRDLATTSARRKTEREAVEEGLALLAERDAQLDALENFVLWAKAEWGEATEEEKLTAEKIWQQR